MLKFINSSITCIFDSNERSVQNRERKIRKERNASGRSSVSESSYPLVIYSVSNGEQWLSLSDYAIYFTSADDT